MHANVYVVIIGLIKSANFCGCTGFRRTRYHEFIIVVVTHTIGLIHKSAFCSIIDCDVSVETTISNKQFLSTSCRCPTDGK